MIDRRILAFGVACPKCEASLKGQYRFCSNVKNCSVWKTYGGEHLHVQCSLCLFVRVTVCADFQEEPKPSFNQVNKWLDDLVEEHNLESELDPDWEPSSLDSELD